MSCWAEKYTMVTALLVSSATSTTELWAGTKFSPVSTTAVWLLLTWCPSLSSCMALLETTTLSYSVGLSPAAHAATDTTGTQHRPHSLCSQGTWYEPTALTFSMREFKILQYKSQDIVNCAGNKKCRSPDHSSKWAARLLYLLWQETVSFS